jgi:hypothetical protein
VFRSDFTKGFAIGLGVGGALLVLGIVTGALKR